MVSPLARLTTSYDSRRRWIGDESRVDLGEIS